MGIALSEIRAGLGHRIYRAIEALESASRRHNGSNRGISSSRPYGVVRPNPPLTNTVCYDRIWIQCAHYEISASPSGFVGRDRLPCRHLDRLAYHGATGWPSARDTAILCYPGYGHRVPLIATKDMIGRRVFADIETDMPATRTLEHQHSPRRQTLRPQRQSPCRP
ncbi:hypothetical protein SPHINGOT1_120310 [Sphingomonas sp. T1]|nr:hypothetical protein SPHINGOT1_120310 [Sphingomonas sp. T1]